MKKRSWIALVTASAFIASTALSVQVSAESNSSIQQKYKEAQNDKNKIQSDIKSKDAQIKEYKEKMKQADETIKAIQKEIEPIEKELQQREVDLKQSEDAYNALVSNMYEEGVFSPLAMLLQADNWKEFMANFDMVKMIADRKYDLFNEVKKKRDLVKEKMDELNVKRDLQQKEIDESKKLLVEIVEAQKKDKTALLKANEVIEQYEDEMIEVNRDLIASGKLNFPYTGPMQKPINSNINSGFGYRMHPIYHRMILHKGVDFPGSVGTPIYAAADGVVVSSKASSGYGWLLTIYHGDKNGVPIYSRYAHSYSRQILVRVGEMVTKGQQITSVGANGQITGPHLHFEVFKGANNAVDPELYF